MGLAEVRALLGDPPLLIWALFVILLPFYVGPSGLPQPANFLILLLLPFLARRWDGRLLDMARPFRLLVLFTGYATLMNLVWSIVGNAWSINLKQGFLLSPTFYFYNSVLLFVLLLMYARYRQRFLRATVLAVLASVLVQVGLSFVMRDYVVRAELMFNSPNQLGYYALLCACILLLALKQLQLSTLQVSVGLTACCYLALMSASKAALGSIAMLGIALMFSRLRTIVIAALILVVLAVTTNPFSRALEKAQQRIENDEHMGLLEERGYDRVINHPEYWLLGSGEGHYRRFADTTLIGSHELHSSGATLFFCYGIVGLLLFGAFIMLALRGIGARNALIVMPGFAYGMVHQGLRFSLMWVMVGFVMALRHDRDSQRAR